jgi:hypothetical protein
MNTALAAEGTMPVEWRLPSVAKALFLVDCIYGLKPVSFKEPSAVSLSMATRPKDKLTTSLIYT